MVGISLRQNKYEKYNFLKRYRKLRSHLPDTSIMSNEKLVEYLEKYGDIVLKPMGGKRGSGVIRVTEVNWECYELHHEKDKANVVGHESLYEAVNRNIGKRLYIVQQRIPLVTVRGRPFDIRVIVQRKRKSRVWRVTGKVIKVAGKGYIVTNIERSKGTVLPFRTAILRSSVKGVSPGTLKSRINSVALKAASRLVKLFAKQRIFGFDIGITGDGRVWIIEANLSPMLSHFRKLKDRRMYRRILRYKKS